MYGGELMSSDLILYNEWNIGDKVTVVDKPYEDCPFGWVDTMDEFCSREAVIIDKQFYGAYGTYRYIIDIDDRFHSWCGSCFKVEEEAEFDVAEDEFVMLILG